MKRNLLDAATVPLPAEQPLVIPSIDNLDKVELPVMRPIHRVEPVRDEVLDASEGLDNLTQVALDKALEILELPLRMGDEDFGSVLRAQVAQVQAILTTQVRVDEGRFKKKQVDTLGKLIEMIKSEEAKEVKGRVLN